MSYTAPLKPHFEDVQSHYDLSDDFFRLFLDPTQTYSCAFFERDDMTLQEAQLAKIDLSLGKLGLEPGMTLLDVGCGWGATMRRAIEKYDVNVVGLTLSRNQQAHVERTFAEMDTKRTRRVLLQGWEQFTEPVDRIVSIGAFEHFGADRYDAFFDFAYDALPADGVMMLHTIAQVRRAEMEARGLPITMSMLRFFKFLLGGDLSRAATCRRPTWSWNCPERPASPPIACNRCRSTTPDSRLLGGGARVASRRGHCDPVRRGLRPLHPVPDRVRGPVPRQLHRRLPVHPEE